MSNLYVFKTKKKNTAFLICDRKKFKCYVGKNGIGKKTREGDNVTPRGTYKLLSVFYRPDKIKSLKTFIPKKKIIRSLYWCVNPKSSSYNMLQRNGTYFFSEKLYRSDSLYDVFITLSYNINPSKKFKGSAIFIHCLDEKTKYTAGCLAFNKRDIMKILKLIKPTSKLIIF